MAAPLDENEGRHWTQVQQPGGPEIIRFFKASAKYDVLSNMFMCQFTAYQTSYHSVEQCFQHRKMLMCENKLQAAKIMQATTAASCKTLGGKHRAPMSREQQGQWSDASIVVMRDALRAKFTQDAHLRRRLLETGDAILVEQLQRFPDSHWGVKRDGVGRNLLGQLLMQLRDDLSAEEEQGSTQEQLPPKNDVRARSSLLSL